MPLVLAQGSPIFHSSKLNQGQRLMELFIPYEKYDAMQALRAAGNILEETHEESGTRIKVLIAEDKLWKVKRSLE